MINEYMAAFAENLKYHIHEKGLSIAGLARATGIPQQTLSRYIRCKRLVSLEYLCILADYFGEDIDVLIGRREF